MPGFRRTYELASHKAPKREAADRSARSTPALAKGESPLVEHTIDDLAIHKKGKKKSAGRPHTSATSANVGRGKAEPGQPQSPPHLSDAPEVSGSRKSPTKVTDSYAAALKNAAPPIQESHPKSSKFAQLAKLAVHDDAQPPRAEDDLPDVPNVFDFLDLPVASSGDQPPDASSAEAAAAPSSKSPSSSPTTARHQSLTGEQAKTAPPAPVWARARGAIDAPIPSQRNTGKHPSVEDVHEDAPKPGSRPSSTGPENQPLWLKRSLSSNDQRDHSAKLQGQEEALRKHVSFTQQPPHPDLLRPQQQTLINHHAHWRPSAYTHQIPMQQYARTPPPAPTPPQLVQTPVARPGPIVTGYEQLAHELTNPRSPVAPLYRRFEYLNNRILLHLQDELSEMEEQLQALDEYIAGLYADAAKDGRTKPASRRDEAALQGTEVLQRRIDLLARIAIKSEQYYRTLSSYAAVLETSSPADKDRIVTYRQWLSRHNPISEVETRFLRFESDLVTPATRSHQRAGHRALTIYLMLALMLSLLFVSTLVGRLVVAGFVVIGGFAVRVATPMRMAMLWRQMKMYAGG